MVKMIAFHVGTERPKELGTFYQKVLNLEPAWASDDMIGFMIDDFRLEIMKHDQVSGKNTDPARLFFNLMVDDVRAEFKRIVALGAGVVQEPYVYSDEDTDLVFATLADLDGNYFQLVSMT